MTKPLEEMTREELEVELSKPVFPPRDWKERALAKPERARRILAESPMGRGRL